MLVDMDYPVHGGVRKSHTKGDICETRFFIANPHHLTHITNNNVHSLDIYCLHVLVCDWHFGIDSHRIKYGPEKQNGNKVGINVG